MTARRAEVVICGAGIGGIATAYFLAAIHGVTDVILLDERPPLTLTSDKSTECYRNWWPGPGDAMVRLMNRSIDLIEELARKNGNLFNLNQRGYLYCTLDTACVSDLEAFAAEAGSLGAGEVRQHSPAASTYQPHQPEGFGYHLGGADILTGSALIRKHFPYISSDIAGVLHVRRAGWLSAQLYGQFLLEAARALGVEFRHAGVEQVCVEAGRVTGARLADGEQIDTHVFVNAAGPMVAKVGQMLGVDLPVYNELHLKSSFDDTAGALDRDAPLVILSDSQNLSWTDEEREWLSEDGETRWMTQTLPSGAHCRPEGGAHAQTVLTLWDIHEEAVQPEFPPQMDPLNAELALRGLSRLIPAFGGYLEKLPKPIMDGGYYTKTRENRPLACPLPVEGAYVIGAMSGYGIMASAALGELAAAHIAGADLPGYAPAFDLARYQDPAYQQLLENWGATWQL